MELDAVSGRRCIVCVLVYVLHAVTCQRHKSPDAPRSNLPTDGSRHVRHRASKTRINTPIHCSTGSPPSIPAPIPSRQATNSQDMASEMATFGEGHGAEHLPNGAAPVQGALLGKNRATELGALYSDAAVSAREHGMALAAVLSAPYSNGSVFAVQVSIDEAVGAKAGGPIAVGAKAAGADAGDARGRAGNLSAVVGIIAASSAVTAVAAGTVSPALAFGFFVVLLGGLSLAMSTIRGGGA